MRETSKQAARRIVESINANVAAYLAEEISDDLFHARSAAFWAEAHRLGVAARVLAAVDPLRQDGEASC